MSKRTFLRSVVTGVGTGLAVVPLWGTRAALARPEASGADRAGHARGPALLTLSGRIGAGNRGPLDPALDQLLVKHGVAFDKAHAMDAAALTALPAITIQPTLEYDNQRHTLRGPLLLDVVKAAGARIGGRTALLARAIDGYAVQIDASEAARRRFIVATHLDGRPLSLGGLGPLWVVYDADAFPDMMARPVKERFSLCPWGTYHVDVKET